MLGQNVNQSLNIEEVSFKDRIAIRTNTVDWILTTPNIAFDYDVVTTPYKKNSIGVGLKYNWNTSHTYIPKQVYNLFDLRLDYRFYWRQQPFDERNEWGDWERKWINNAKGWDKVRARISCFRASEHPKQNMSFFVGPYFSISSFSIKLNPSEDVLGRQGTAFGGGFTGGIAMPLYGYENGSALDLEIGGSIGWHFASYDLYSVDVESNCYHAQGHRSKWIPFPLVTDARVALVYRFRTIAKQHKEVDYDLLDRRYIAFDIERDNSKVKEYNASIKASKSKIDKHNQEIALYKQTVEEEPGFNTAYSLEYLTPYVYMMSAPRKYIRHNKDTLPKIKIDSMGQITDRILLNVRNDIDSIPHVTSEQIDAEFVKVYNNLSGQDGKKVNRTELIKNIYNQLNTYFVEDNNNKLTSGVFSIEAYTEKVKKFDVATQQRPEVEIAYKDSVRTVEMTHNEKVEWRNSIKKKAWTDVQNRMKGIYPERLETTHAVETIAPDSIVVDSIRLDSIGLDSIRLDNIGIDSIAINAVETEVAFNNCDTCRKFLILDTELFISLKETEDEE